MSLVAIDPGLTIGLALRHTNQEWATLAIPRIDGDTANMPKLLETLDNVKSVTEDGGNKLIVIIESFATMQYMSKYGLLSVRLIGSVEAWAHIRRVELVTQSPQAKLPYMEEAKIMLKERHKLLGKALAFEEHNKDALAHILRYEHRVLGKPRTITAG